MISSTGDRRRAEQLLDRCRALVVGVDPLGGSGSIIGRAGERDAAGERAERLDHVVGVLDQGRAVADQLVAALRARIERRAGHRHHLAPGLGGEPRGDQRARLGRASTTTVPSDRPAMIRLR